MLLHTLEQPSRKLHVHIVQKKSYSRKRMKRRHGRKQKINTLRKLKLASAMLLALKLKTRKL